MTRPLTSTNFYDYYNNFRPNTYKRIDGWYKFLLTLAIIFVCLSAMVLAGGFGNIATIMTQDLFSSLNNFVSSLPFISFVYNSNAVDAVNYTQEYALSALFIINGVLGFITSVMSIIVSTEEHAPCHSCNVWGIVTSVSCIVCLCGLFFIDSVDTEMLILFIVYMSVSVLMSIVIGYIYRMEKSYFSYHPMY